MLLGKWAKKAERHVAPLDLQPAIALQKLVLSGRGETILVTTLNQGDPKRMKKSLAWIKRNAAKNCDRGLKETGSEVLRKIRDGKIKA